MKTARLAMFLSRIVLRGRLVPLAAAGSLLLVSDAVSSRIPGDLVAFVIGSYAAALSALAVGVLVATSSQLGEYCIASMGCSRFAAGVGIAASIAVMVSSLAAFSATALYAGLEGSASLGFSIQALSIALSTSSLTAYGYALIAQLVRSSMPLLLLVVLVAKLAQGIGWVRGLYLVPFFAALVGVALQVIACSLPAARVKLARGAV